MVFVPPTWFEGLLYYSVWFIIPFIIAIIYAVKASNADFDKEVFYVVVGFLFLILSCFSVMVLADIGWHYQFEEASVQTKVITVDNWQPVFGCYWGEIRGADDLMMQTKDGELFLNTENFLFNKFNTRDILSDLKPNGTYEIKYYGWREGFNNGAPNILSVEKVIDENGTSTNDISKYMNKRSIIYDDSVEGYY